MLGGGGRWFGASFAPELWWTLVRPQFDRFAQEVRKALVRPKSDVSSRKFGLTVQTDMGRLTDSASIIRFG